MPAMADLPCPCDPARRYAGCCGPLHAGAPAGDAEALMRSRYSAYVMGLEDYLLSSWHPTTRPQPPLLDSGARLKWLRLKVIAHRAIDADHAEVEFEARCMENGARRDLREDSRFVRENGHWFYVDGVIG
ncbi:YchJ family protein [Solilutibacter silvestris]|uniref:YchJ family protein n=1 Tax=Solilutibacter silvestris TaxID=1645665 RepID=UPI003D349BC4